MLRSTALLTALLLTAAIAPALAQPVEPGSSTTGNKVFALSAMNGSGQSGTVALQPFGGRTEVEIHLLHGPKDGAQSATINAGACSSAKPKSKYALTTVRNGFSETVLDVPVSQLANANLSVNVGGAACGDL
ncbi:MAG TPA: hypothetical protein VFE16_12505 [Candidatus Cybelea sp.]|jgi:opacity protein-like surface antigen|nr:hypothetical protein [Candidatus Cybelea sp.]